MDQTRKRKILAAVFAILGAIIFIAGIIGAIHAITRATGTDSIGVLRSKTRETLSGILHNEVPKETIPSNIIILFFFAYFPELLVVGAIFLAAGLMTFLAKDENRSIQIKKVTGVLKDRTMLIALVLVYLFFTDMTVGSLFSPANFTALIDQNTYVFILGTGMLMCMLTGGNIDLSCGAVVCLLGALGGVFMSTQAMAMGTGVSILLMMLIGIGYGMILGFLIAYVHIPPWIATLTGFLAFRGLGTEILSVANPDTKSLTNFPDGFKSIFYGRVFPTAEGVFNWPCFIFGLLAAGLVVLTVFMTRKNRLAKGYEADSIQAAAAKSGIGAAAILLLTYKLAYGGGLPTTLLWAAGIVLIYSFITSKTTIGRHFYVVGSNIEAARLSGVNTRRIMFVAYLNMAVLTSIATMANMARFGNAFANAGKNYEMDAISACVVGGVSASGGAGSVLGMVIGATLIGVINLGMSLISLDQNYQRVVKGVVLLGAVVFDILSKKKQK